MLVVAFAAAGTAQASILYKKGGSSIYLATNSGKDARVVGNGLQPQLSPDGQIVLYEDSAGNMFVVPTAGGAPRPVGPGVKCGFGCYINFSPDGKSVLHARREGRARSHSDGRQRAGAARDRRLLQAESSHRTHNGSLLIRTRKRRLFHLNGVDHRWYANPTPADFASYPVWTNAGIVVSTTAVVGRNLQTRVVLLNAAGGFKRVLQRKTFKSAKAFKAGRGIQDPYSAAGANVVTSEYGKGRRMTLRLLGTYPPASSRRRPNSRTIATCGPSTGAGARSSR